MKKAVWSAVAAAALLAMAAPASAQLATTPVNATITVNNRAVLLVSGDVVFTDADPDAFPTLTAPSIDVDARARVAPTTDLQVTVVAASDYFDATSTIPVAGLQWTASGTSFAGSGAMSSTTPVQVAAWTGPASQHGTQTYTLPNLWTYAPGSHSVTLTYTLATP